MENQSRITIEATINAPVAKVWNIWSAPEHITQWASPSEDWHTTKAENDLRAGGAFNSRMEAKDGSFGFDFAGIYDDIQTHRSIDYTLGDGRKVNTIFEEQGGTTKVTQTFDPENQNPVEMQRGGWQAILDNMKKYTEAN